MSDEALKAKSTEKVRGIRLIAAGIALFFVIFVLIRIFFDESKKFSLPLINNNAMFVALWAIIILFSITFLFILIRNLIKLYYDKRKPLAGGRFKKRLVFFFISFSIVPTLLLFFFATDLISNSIEKWFKADIDLIINKFEELDKSYYEKAKDDLKHFAKLISDDIKKYRKYTLDNRSFLRNSTKQQMIEYNLDVVNIYVNQNEEITFISPSITLHEYRDLPQHFIYGQLGGSDPMRIDQMKKGLLIRHGVDFETRGQDKILVIIGRFFPEKYIKNLQTLKRPGKVHLHAPVYFYYHIGNFFSFLVGAIPGPWDYSTD
jgi:two-component system nitrogen regulation sensor histidine kinase NtrY